MKKSLILWVCPLLFLSVALSSCSSGDGYGYYLDKVDKLQIVYGSRKTTCKAYDPSCYTSGSIYSYAGNPVFTCLFENCTDFSGLHIILLAQPSVIRYSIDDLKVGDTFKTDQFDCLLMPQFRQGYWRNPEFEYLEANDGKITVIDKYTDDDNKLSITLKLDGLKFNTDSKGMPILVNGFVKFKEAVVYY